MTDAILSPAACRAARALLGWPVSRLVKEAGVSPNTLVRVEAGGEVARSSRAKLLAAFTAAGVEVLPPPADGARRIVLDAQ